MIVVNYPHGTHDADVISAGPHVWKPVTDFQPGFAIATVTRLQWHDDFEDFSLLLRWIQQVFVDLVFVQHVVGERGLIDRLAGVLVERRLWIETLHMT
jgi:hypothetical protein